MKLHIIGDDDLDDPDDDLGDDFGDDFFVFVALVPPLPPPRRVNVFLNRKDFFFVV